VAEAMVIPSTVASAVLWQVVEHKEWITDIEVFGLRLYFSMGQVFSRACGAETMLQTTSGPRPPADV